jgi:predicted Zn-dependent protease
MGAGMLSMLGAVVAGATLGTEVGRGVGQIFQIAGAGLIASYSRGQERQADDIGQRISAASGWDPAAMPRFLETLERDTELRHPEAGRPHFLASHPVTRERVENTHRLAAQLATAPEAPIAVGRDAFLAKLDGLLVGPDPEEGVFRGSRFLHPGLRLVIDFPAKWKTANGKAVVGAAAPEKDAVVLFQAQERGQDPKAAAARFSEANQAELMDPQSLRIGGFRAFRARALVQSRDGPVGLDLTWVAHPAAIFRFTGMSPAPRFSQRAAALERVARSFRRLSDAELAGIRDVRLQIARVRHGEGLTDVSRRTQNTWSIDETAVVNGLQLGKQIAPDRSLKVAVEVPYAR